MLGKKKFYKRSFSKKSKGTTKVVPKSVKRYVKSMIHRNIETKYFDTANYLTTVTNAGYITDQSAVVQGIGSKQRVGNTIQPIRFDMHYVLQMNSLALPASGWYTNMYRVIAFRWWPDDSSDVPQLSELLDYASVSYTVIAPYKFDDKERFEILYDKTHILNTSNPQQHVHTSVPLKKSITFNDSALYGNGHVYVAYISDQTVNLPTILYDFRLTYKDA